MRIVLNGETGRMQEYGTGADVPTVHELHGPPPPDLVPGRPALRLVPAAEPRPPAPSSARMSRTDVLRMVRKRVFELRAELRRHDSLLLELAQLKAVLAAAASARPPMRTPDQGTKTK